MILSLLKWILIGFIILTIIFLLGPKPDYPMYDLKPKYLKVSLKNLDTYISEKESKIEDLKPDNEARVVWYQDSIQKTKYSLVYLHGFSSSQGEGNPVHRIFADRYGMNLYLSRIKDHGRSDDNTFKNLTPSDLIESAKEAIAIGALIGEKVILMSCSTGGTYSLMLAPEDKRVHSLIMYSPNISLRDRNAKLVTYPWGKQILNGVIGGEYNRITYTEEAKQYWNSVYHTDGIIALQALIDDGMKPEIFKNLSLPVYIGAYYKNENNQDDVVSVAAMEDMFSNISTPKNLKEMNKFPDVGRHVFTSDVMVSDFEEVLNSTYKFTENVLEITPK